MLPVGGVQSNEFGFDEDVIISKFGNGGLLDLSLSGLLNDNCVVLGHFEVDLLDEGKKGKEF